MLKTPVNNTRESTASHFEKLIGKFSFMNVISSVAILFMFLLVAWFGTYVVKNSVCNFSPDTSFCKDSKPQEK